MNFNIPLPSGEKNIKPIVKEESNPKIEMIPSSKDNESLNIPLLKGAKQPLICFFHAIFKLVSLIFYLVLNSIINCEIITFIIILILNAIDFWTVKNIIGRF